MFNCMYIYTWSCCIRNQICSLFYSICISISIGIEINLLMEKRLNIRYYQFKWLTLTKKEYNLSG